MVKKLLFLFVLVNTALSPVLAEDAAAPVEAEESPFAVEYTLGMFSNYMFRGQQYFDGASIQQSINASYSNEDYGDFWTNIWSHMPGESARQDDFIELDYTVGWTKTLDPVSFTIGNAAYTLPKKDGDPFDDCNEVFASIFVDTYLSPVFSFYNYTTVYYSQYYELNLSHAFEVESPVATDPVTLTPFVAIGATSNQQRVYGQGGLVQITYGASAEIPVGSIVIAPTVNYSKSYDEFTLNKFWAGLNLKYAF